MWRSDRQDGRSAGSLHEFIRAALAARAGACTRTELFKAISADPQTAERLAQSKGFAAVLGNMKSSGFIEFDGELIRRTSRRFGRRRT